MLNQIEKEKLELLANDDVLINAAYKLFFQATEDNRPEAKDIDNNLLLGEKYRAFELSKQIINSGFTLLRSYKKMDKQNEKQLNRAR